MTELRFGVLGPLQVLRGSTPVAVPTGRRRAILACLLVHVGQPVSADVLVEAAWGEDLPEDPRAALHTALSRLRSALGADVLVSRGAGYTLDMAAESVDAHRFESLRAEAGSAPVDQALAMHQEAASLWRGPAYVEFADREFAVVEAARLDRLRLEAIEEHAAVLLSADRHDVAAGILESLLDEHPLREHGLELLMTALYRAGRQTDALARFRAHRDVMREELGLDPATTLVDLESRILGQSLAPHSVQGVARQPPAWLDTSTAFVGRDTVQADLIAAVTSNRLTTVTGMGGVGKSRLVAETLPALTDRLQAPVIVVELARVGPGQVMTAVADALALTPQADAIADDLYEYLGTTRILLVLDNCEHLRSEVTGLVQAVVRRCPRVRLLATSRHRLGVTSERVIPLVPLPIPGARAGRAELEASPAMQLLADRVNRLRASAGIDPGDAGPMLELCRRLDGLPLGIELAASRVAALGIDVVVRSFAEDGRSEPFHDLSHVVAWSARLLTAEQRRLMGCLAVFAGDFNAEDVADLAGRLGPWEDPGGAMGALEELVESHLLVGRARGAVPDFHMVALVRSFAQRLLSDSGREEQVRHMHAQWVRDVTQRAAAEWVSGAAAAADRRLVRLGPDIGAALRWAPGAGRLDLAAEIAGAVKSCLHWLPGAELAELIIATAEQCAAAAPDPQFALALGAGALASAQSGDRDKARRLAHAALAQAADDLSRFLALLALSVTTFYSGEHEESRAWVDRLIELSTVHPGHRVEPFTTRALLACANRDIESARTAVSIALAGADAVGAEAARAFALYASGEIELHEEPARAAVLFREAAAEAQRIGASQVSQIARLALFAVLVRDGDHDEELDLVMPLLRDLRRSGAWPQIWTTVRIASELMARCGRPEDAAFLLAAVDAAPTAPPLVAADVSRYGALRAELGRELGASLYGRISGFASGLPRGQVVDRAATVLTAVREA